jgi:hypothetical protein
VVKIHGNWCGPNWTGGRKLSAEEYAKRGYSWSSACTDALDCACRDHDRACSSPKGCSKKADTALIKAAKKLQLSELERITQIGIVANPFSSVTSRSQAEKKLDLDTKAGMVESAITLARLTRIH